MSLRQLKYVPSEAEEEYLENTGKLVSWTDTIRNWMKEEQDKDKKQNYIQIMDQVQNSLILIFIGILSIALTLIIPITTGFYTLVYTTLFIISFISITYGICNIIWRVISNGK